MGSTDVSSRELVIEDLDHLGLVAGVVDQIGLVECIDAQLGKCEGERISAGQVMKAMILNGLGFVSDPLYLFGRFFEGKPTEHASEPATAETDPARSDWGRLRAAAERHPDIIEILGPPPFEAAREESAARAKA
jgi:hypothetical protein